MPADKMSILFNSGEIVNLNMNKVMKYVKSKQGVEAAKRFENNRLLANYWDPKDIELKEQLAEESLRRFIDSVFKDLNVYYRSAINAQIRVAISDKIQSARDLLSNLGLTNLGELADKIINYAQERDKHLDIVKTIYAEAKQQGRTKLSSEQRAAVDMEQKEANAYNRKRNACAELRLDGVEKNEEILNANKTEVRQAYEYLYGKPWRPTNNN